MGAFGRAGSRPDGVASPPTMRHLLISDIHSNVEALDACIERAAAAGFDSVLCCGDIVGYGPDPNAAVARVRALEPRSVRGNHDRVAAGLGAADDFNLHAKTAVPWTRDALSHEATAYLRDLPAGPRGLGGGAQLVHGAVTGEDDYILSSADAAESFRSTGARLTFFGHTHHACVFSLGPAGGVRLETPRGPDERWVAALDASVPYLINPGSVGQPRDHDARAAFAIWDTATSRVEFHRVAYPLETTQRKMRAAGLPTPLIERLRHGR